MHVIATWETKHPAAVVGLAFTKEQKSLILATPNLVRRYGKAPRSFWDYSRKDPYTGFVMDPETNWFAVSRSSPPRILFSDEEDDLVLSGPGTLLGCANHRTIYVRTENGVINVLRRRPGGQPDWDQIEQLAGTPSSNSDKSILFVTEQLGAVVAMPVENKLVVANNIFEGDWPSCTLDSQIVAVTPSRDGRFIFCATEKGVAHCLCTESAAHCWSCDVDDEIHSLHHYVDNHAVLVGGNFDGARVIDDSTGELTLTLGIGAGITRIVANPVRPWQIATASVGTERTTLRIFDSWN